MDETAIVMENNESIALKIICVNRLSFHQMRKLHSFQQQFQASKSATGH